MWQRKEQLHFTPRLLCSLWIRCLFSYTAWALSQRQVERHPLISGGLWSDGNITSSSKSRGREAFFSEQNVIHHHKPSWAICSWEINAVLNLSSTLSLPANKLLGTIWNSSDKNKGNFTLEKKLVHLIQNPVFIILFGVSFEKCVMIYFFMST